MLFTFKRRFVPFLFDGSKTHTIRAMRKDGLTAKPGKTCHCYMDARQKAMTLLGRWECVKVQPIEVYVCGDGMFSMILDGEQLSLDEKNALAYRDGFRSEDPFLEMMRFWVAEHGKGKVIGICVTKKCKPLEPKLVNGKGVEFCGHMTHWRYDQSTRNPKWREVLERIRLSELERLTK